MNNIIIIKFKLSINYFFNYIRMNYLIESIFVGLYVGILYLFFSPFIKNFYLLLLVCGFFKHFLGSSFGLWTWYCNNGEACLRTLSQDQYYEANTLYLIQESIYESIIFVICSASTSGLSKSKLSIDSTI
jgi:hypothetical protein